MRVVSARALWIGGVLIAAALLASAPAAAHEGDVQPPRAIHQPRTSWPEGHASEHDLIVPVVLTVDTDGRVAAVEVEASVGEPFDSAAVAAARGWLFEPAQGPAGPMRARVRAVVRFVGEPAASQTVDAHHHGEPHDHPDDDHDVPPPPAEEPEVPRPEAAAQKPVSVVVRGTAPPRSASEVRRDREVLSAAPHRTASDLLLTVPGVFVTQHSGEGKAHQIFFRGFDALHGQDIELWVAGAPVNEVSNVHGQGYADLHFVMPEVVREVSAWPGPYSPHQGDFAVAGSMAYELGYAEPGATAKLSTGSFGAQRAFLAYRPQDAPESTFGAFEVYETNGFGVGRAARRTSAIGQITHPLSDHLELRLSASTYAARFNSAGVLRLTDVESGRYDRFDSYDTGQGGHSTRTQLVGEIRHDEDQGWTLSLAPFLVLRSLGLRHNYTGFLADPVQGDSIQQLNDSTTVGARGSVRRRMHLLSDHDALEIGLSTRHDFVDQSQRRRSVVSREVTETQVDASVVAAAVGGYFDAALHPISRIAVRGGVRLDGLSYRVQNHLADGSASSAQGAHVGKKLTVDGAVAPGLHVLASYGEGFRSPQARGLGDGETTPFTDVESLEAGVRFRDGQRVAAAVAGFYTWLSDDLVFDERTARNEPVPATERTGAVVDFVAEPAPWFTSALGFTYTRATFRESNSRYQAGDLVPFVPQVVARSDLAVRPHLAHVFGRALVGRAGAGLTYLYRRPIPYGELGSNVFLTDLLMAARLQEVELSFEIFNLLDTNWNDGEFVYASNFERGAAAPLVPARHVTAGAPRTLMLSLALFL